MEGETELDWGHVKPLAYGCASDYAVASEDGLRLPMNGRLAAAEKPITPVTALQQGLPVLMFVLDSKQFEQRVVKVDNRLHFLYVLVGTAGGKEKASQPIVVGLNQIWSVKEGVNALALCEIHDVKDENLTAESAVVVEIGSHRPEIDPPLVDLLIFCTPPKLRLRERILACSAGRGGAGGSGEKGKQMVVPHMDGVRIKDWRRVWRYTGVGSAVEPADVDVQFLTSSGHPGGKPVTVPLVMATGNSMAEKIIEKVHKQNELTPIDKQRIRFVIHETEVIQKWAEHFSAISAGDFLAWMQSGSLVDSPVANKDSNDVFVQPGKEFSNNVLNGNANAQQQRDAQFGYASMGLDSVKAALAQLLDLENERSEREEEDEKWHLEHEKLQAEKTKAPSRLISMEEVAAGLPGAQPMSASDAGSMGRRSIDSMGNRRSLEPGWDVNAASSRAQSMVGGNTPQRGLQQHEMVLPEASAVMNQGAELDMALGIHNPRLGPNQAGNLNGRLTPNAQQAGNLNGRLTPNAGRMTPNGTSTNAGRLSIGSGRMAAPGTASAHAPSEVHAQDPGRPGSAGSIREQAGHPSRSAEDEHRRWMEVSNEHLNDLDRAHERQAMQPGALQPERPKQDKGFFDSWLSTNMPGVAKVLKNEFECGVGR